MNDAETLVDQATDVGDQTNLVVVLRPSEGGMQALLVADEKGRWSIPGGHAKDDESHAQAATREVKEETGLDVEVQPLMWADHAARKIASNVFYAVVEPDTEGSKPGGGDVTEVRWASVRDLGALNGTDRLVIQVAANRVHNPQQIVDDAVEFAESIGYAVANVAAHELPVPGIYLRLEGSAAPEYALRLSEWANSLGWPACQFTTTPCESTTAALERAHHGRRLTPMLESLIRVSDVLWRYESKVLPNLEHKHIVIEVGEGLKTEPLLKRGMPPDLLDCMTERIPKPTGMLNVGEDFNLSLFQILKNLIENLQNPDDPKYHMDRLSPRDVQVPWKMEFVRVNPDDIDNPIMRCPKCKHEGPVMADFSLLAAGFNGIQGGDEDDIDAQECGMCAAKMESDDAERASEEATKQFLEQSTGS